MEYKISWTVRTGRQHQARNLPGQDRVQVYRDGDRVCVALADGAGSRENSHLGAECVTRTVSQLLGRDFDRLWEMDQDQRGREVLARCLEALEQLTPPIYELASTLLFFAADGGGHYLSGHLGDGVQILVEEGTSRVFSPPENGAYQNETYFLTGADAAEHFRLRQGQLEEPGVLLMMSDGVAESLYQYQSRQPAPACATIARWIAEGEEDVITQALEQNMERTFAARSADDLSLAVIAWE